MLCSGVYVHPMLRYYLEIPLLGNSICILYSHVTQNYNFFFFCKLFYKKIHDSDLIKKLYVRRHINYNYHG